MTLKVRKALARDTLNDIVRMHKIHRPFAKPGSVIAIEIGEKKAYAVVRPPLENFEQDEISFDWATREKLEISSEQKKEFIFRKASCLDEFLWAWNATDAMPRVAARLGVISLILGVIGLFLGVISIFR